MQSLMRKPSVRTARSLVLGLGALILAAAAMAASPYFSGPSVAKPAAATKFDGKGFAPNSAVTVVVTSPSGATTSVGAVTGADGALSYTLVPSQTGAYSITVADSGGRALAKAVVAVLP